MRTWPVTIKSISVKGARVPQLAVTHRKLVAPVHG